MFEVSRQCIDKHSVPQLIWDSPEELTFVLLPDKSAAELVVEDADRGRSQSESFAYH